ncbi:MAG: DHH family phosphoesterase, partial [Kiritimatiellia bacterium]
MTGSNASITSLAAGIGKILAPDTRLAITTHVRPDGDAIGSALGLYHLLQSRQFKAQIVGLEKLPQRYAWLDDAIDAISPDSTKPQNFDALIVLDTGSIDRAPEFVQQWQGLIPIVNIDHHPTNTLFGDENYVISEASAVAEILTRMAVEAHWEISPQAATALWVGITTDSGRFAYSCTSPATLQAAAELLKAGIDTPTIDQRVFQNISPGALRLQAMA